MFASHSPVSAGACSSRECDRVPVWLCCPGLNGPVSHHHHQHQSGIQVTTTLPRCAAWSGLSLPSIRVFFYFSSDPGFRGRWRVAHVARAAAAKKNAPERSGAQRGVGAVTRRCARSRVGSSCGAAHAALLPRPLLLEFSILLILSILSRDPPGPPLNNMHLTAADDAKGTPPPVPERGSPSKRRD